MTVVVASPAADYLALRDMNSVPFELVEDAGDWEDLRSFSSALLVAHIPAHISNLLGDTS